MFYDEYVTRLVDAVKGSSHELGLDADQITVNRFGQMPKYGPFVACYPTIENEKVSASGTSERRRILCTVFVAPALSSDAQDDMIAAVEMAEAVEKILKVAFVGKYVAVDPPTFDARYANYSVASFTFRVGYTSRS